MTPYCRVLLCATMGAICLIPLSADRALPDRLRLPTISRHRRKLPSERCSHRTHRPRNRNRRSFRLNPDPCPRRAAPILEVPPEREAQEKGKRQESRKKPLGSLILTVKLALSRMPACSVMKSKLGRMGTASP